MASGGKCGRCKGPLPTYIGNGRPRAWCSPDCRKAGYRASLRKSSVKKPNEWWIPQEIRDRVLAEHPIGLDAAACDFSSLAPNNWLGPKHPDKSRRDAITFEDWSELTPSGSEVWVNPPSIPIPLLCQFLERAAKTASKGNAVMVLVPASVGTN